MEQSKERCNSFNVSLNTREICFANVSWLVGHTKAPKICLLLVFQLLYISIDFQEKKYSRTLGFILYSCQKLENDKCML